MESETYQPNEALRRQRLLRGWSQKKVADLLGTSEDIVSRWEHGKKKTSPFYQEKLCDLFGKTADELGFLYSADVAAQKTGYNLNQQEDRHSIENGTEPIEAATSDSSYTVKKPPPAYRYRPCLPTLSNTTWKTYRDSDV
jgi:transcriptional regulator with XRE-family HTH domain